MTDTEKENLRLLEKSANVENARYLLHTFNSLKKYRQLSTGCPRIDDQVRAAHGNWLLPSEERNAIEDLLNRAKAKGKEEDQELVERLQRLKDVPDPTDDFVPYYTIVIKKIPFETKDGKKGVMRLKQLLIWSKPITNSGCFRITYLKRINAWTIIDAKTGKKIDQLPLNSLNGWLTHIFDRVTIQRIDEEMWLS